MRVKPALKSHSIWMIALIFVTAIIRIIYWLHVRDEVWHITPGMDPAFYSAWANAIITGNGADYLPFPRAPLYPYLLAFFQVIFGQSRVVPIIMNLIADSVSVILIFKLAVRLHSKRSALIASLIFAFSGASIYYSNEILMTSLSTACGIAFLYTLISLWKQPTWRLAALCGILAAIFGLFRPNALIIIPVSMILIYLATLRNGKKMADGIKNSLSHFAAASILILPVIFINFTSSGRLIPISTQGGVNFYIGNHRSANGWSSELPEYGANWTDSDAKATAERDAGKPLTNVQTGDQLFKMGLNEIISDPGGWSVLFLRKTLLLLQAGEIGNNRPLSLPKEAFPPLRFLMLLSFGAIFPFAFVGIIGNRRDHNIRLITLFLVLSGSPLLFFFINSRYRMPLIPALTILAAIGAVRLWDEIRKRKFFTRDSIVFLAVALLSYPGWIKDDFENEAQSRFVVGNAFLRSDKPDEALDAYRQIYSLIPDYPELHLNIGVALLEIGDTSAAIQEFDREIMSPASRARAENNLGAIAETRDSLQTAWDYYSKALDSNPYLEDARGNAARVLMKIGDRNLQAGETGSALKFYYAASEYSGENPPLLYRTARVLFMVGNLEEAEDYLQNALEIDPEYQPARNLLARLINE